MPTWRAAHQDEFLATMNHELRTPLNTMLILAEVLQQGVLGPLNEKATGEPAKHRGERPPSAGADHRDTGHR